VANEAGTPRSMGARCVLWLTALCVLRVRVRRSLRDAVELINKLPAKRVPVLLTRVLTHLKEQVRQAASAEAGSCNASRSSVR
jgi:hypothetical protein